MDGDAVARGFAFGVLWHSLNCGSPDNRIAAFAVGRGSVAEEPLKGLLLLFDGDICGWAWTPAEGAVVGLVAEAGPATTAAAEMGLPVQSCVGEEGWLWIRGDDGVDLPADDDSLGPSGRYVIYTTTVTTLYFHWINRSEVDFPLLIQLPTHREVSEIYSCTANSI